MQLSKEQLEAIETIDGPIIVYSCAGSGKTTVVINRIKRMIEEGINPSKIFVTTYTKKAAREMLERLEKNNINTKGMFVGTLHSYCYKFLLELINKGKYKEFNICSEEDIKKIIETNIKDVYYLTKYDGVNGIIQKFKLIDNKKINPDNDEDLQNIYNTILSKTKKENKLTFDQIIMETINILKQNKEELELIQKKYKYFIVDEFQDITPLQFELVYLLSNHTNNLCVVGDDDQVIYTWRGASSEYIINFKKYYDNAKIIKLSKNYRSAKKIVDIASEIISKNKNRIEKDIVGENNSTATVYYYHDPTCNMFLNVVGDLINKYVNSGIKKYKDFAILYRNNNLGYDLECKIFCNDIQYKTKKSCLDEECVIAFIEFLKIIYKIIKNDCDVDVDIINYYKKYNNEFNYDNLTIDEILKETNNKDIDKFVIYYKNLNSATNKIIKLYSSKKSNSCLFYLTYLKDIFIYNFIDNNTLSALANNKCDYEKILSIFIDMYNHYLEKFSFKNYFKKIDKFLLYINKLKDNDDVVTLSTIHSVKGLEFDTVFLYNCNDLMFDNISEEAISDDMRLFYVAVTRAKKNLIIIVDKDKNLEYYFKCLDNIKINDLSEIKLL